MHKEMVLKLQSTFLSTVLLLLSQFTKSSCSKNALIQILHKSASINLTAVFFETGAMSTPTKLQDLTNCG